MNPLYTIGHSIHELDEFLALLTAHGITAVADVRSQPVSRLPQFNREMLQAALKRHGIGYVFLGRELGARREEAEAYEGGCVRYEKIAALPRFQEGLDRVVAGAERHTIALICAEKEPLDCHRSILVCRHLRGRVPEIRHILADGTLEDHAETENRLLELAGITPGQGDLFHSDEELLEGAYEARGHKIAYQAAEEDAT